MTHEKKTSEELGSEVEKSIGRLETSTDALKRETDNKCNVDSEDVSNILALIGRTILKIFR